MPGYPENEAVTAAGEIEKSQWPRRSKKAELADECRVKIHHDDRRKLLERKATSNSFVLKRISRSLAPVNCKVCPPNGGCNAVSRVRRGIPRPDRYKNHRENLVK